MTVKDNIPKTLSAFTWYFLKEYRGAVVIYM